MYDIVMSKNSIWGTNEVVPLINIVLNVVATDVEKEQDFACVSDSIPTSELLICYLYPSYKPF